MNYPDVMIDCETAGLDDNAAILSIGAASFDMRGLTLGEFYYTAISLESTMSYGGQIDGSTFLWWLQRDDQARQAVVRNACPDLYLALTGFAEWLHTKCEAQRHVKIWTNGERDVVWLRNHYRWAKIEQPWMYYNQHDFRTVKNLYPNVEPDQLKAGEVYHNALDDAVWQANHLLKIRRTLRGIK